MFYLIIAVSFAPKWYIEYVGLANKNGKEKCFGSNCRFLMLETAQQLMECTTTSVTTSSMLPTKAIWGNVHTRSCTQLWRTYLGFICFWFNSQSFKSSCTSPQLSLFPWPTHPAWSAGLSGGLWHYLLPAGLSVPTSALIVASVSVAADLAGEHTFVRPAYRWLSFPAKS